MLLGPVHEHGVKVVAEVDDIVLTLLHVQSDLVEAFKEFLK